MTKTMKFEVVFKKGLDVVARIKGIQKVDARLISEQELTDLVEEVPQLLEKILGLRVHINQV